MYGPVSHKPVQGCLGPRLSASIALLLLRLVETHLIPMYEEIEEEHDLRVSSSEGASRVFFQRHVKVPNYAIEVSVVFLCDTRELVIRC